MGEKEKNAVKKVAIIAVAIMLLIYIGYQVYRMAYSPVETEIAREYTVKATVETDVFVARKEKYIINQKDGTLISVVDDGSRVAKNQEVAVVFSDTEAADTYSRLRELETEIERYKKLSSQSDNYTFNINDLDDNIDMSAMKLVNSIWKKNFTEINESIDDVRDQVVTRQIATGNNIDFQKKLSSLEAEYNELSKKSSKHSSVISDTPGYYISGTDGLEKIVDIEKVKTLSVDDIYGVLKSKAEDVPSGAIGKVVTDFTWYFLCVVDANRTGTLGVGDSVTVNLPFSAVNSVEATVYAINENTGDKTALVLSCNLMNSDISSLRHENAELITNSYTGLRVPSKAIRVNKDGEKGVFVQNGNIIEFRKLNIIYTADDYVLSSADANDDSYVRLYDNIVTEGKNLYDGKIVK